MRTCKGISVEGRCGSESNADAFVNAGRSGLKHNARIVELKKANPLKNGDAKPPV